MHGEAQNDVRAMVSRAAGHKVAIGENLPLAAVVGLATIDDAYTPGTATGNRAATELIEAVATPRELDVWRRERPRTGHFVGALEIDAIDATALAFYRRHRRNHDFAGLHIIVRRVLKRAANGLRATRKWAKRRKETR